MKKIFNVNGNEVEFESIKAIIIESGEKYETDAILIHECKDEFSNGDWIETCSDFPEDEESAVSIYENGDSSLRYYDIDEDTGKYIIDLD